MTDKYIPSEEEIRNTLLRMRSCDIESMISDWNIIAEKWSVSSVSQVHKCLQDSGHIQKMIEYIVRNKEIQEAVS
jgi:hypothetical protein